MIRQTFHGDIDILKSSFQAWLSIYINIPVVNTVTRKPAITFNATEWQLLP